MRGQLTESDVREHYCMVPRSVILLSIHESKLYFRTLPKEKTENMHSLRKKLYSSYFDAAACGLIIEAC